MLLCLITMMKMPVNASQKKVVANKGYNIDIGKKKTVNLQYTAKGNGYFYFNLKNKDDNYVRINVTANYKTYSSDNTYVYGRNSYRSEKYCFKKGTKVTIKIISEYGSRLSFRLSEKKLKNFEKEKNDTVSKATTMKLKKTYNGVAQEGDEDWWTFVAPQSGNYTISAVCVDSQRSVYIEGFKITSDDYILDASCYGGNGWQTVDRVKVSKGDKICVCIKSGYYYSALYKLNIHR